MVTLGVYDLPAMTAFYRDVFGFTLESANDSISFYSLNGTWLGLYGMDALAEDIGIKNDHSGFSGVTFAHNLSSEQAVDELFAAVTAKGAKPVKSPQKVFWGGYSSYIADPEQNYWELAYNPFGWIGPKDD